MPSDTLPIADHATARREARLLVGWHRRQVLVLLALHSAAVLAGLVAPWLLGTLVNSVIAGTSVERIDSLAAVIALSVVLQTGLVWAANRASFVFGENVFSDFRETFAGRLLDLPLTTVERAGSGEIISRTTQDIDAVSNFVRTGLPEVMVGVLSVVFTLAAAFLTNGKLALACLIGLPVIVVSTRWFSRRAKDAFAAELAASAAVNTTVIETVRGAPAVEALDLGETRKRAVSAAVGAARTAEAVPLRLRTVWFPLVLVGYELPLVGVLMIGGWLVAQDQANIGQVATVALYVRFLVDPLNDLVYWYGELQFSLAAFARIVGVGQIKPDRTATAAAPESKNIQAERVRYAYRAGHDVLKSVSVDIRPDERIAVVGLSGAGKSTLGLLLAGVYVPQAGRITLGGVDLKDIPVDQLRSHVALVTQEDYVFSGSVADNLRLGNPDATDAELVEAMAIAKADDWVHALPEGTNTRVGAGGCPLTPAQTQQLALARIVLKNPHTLVLDEATSLLTPAMAGRLERSMSGALRGKTVVVIAHRLQSACEADRVVVMDDGQILEVGSHADLIQQGGPYAKLWDAWVTDDIAPRGPTYR